jgi:hypothetical protein
MNRRREIATFGGGFLFGGAHCRTGGGGADDGRAEAAVLADALTACLGNRIDPHRLYASVSPGTGGHEPIGTIGRKDHYRSTQRKQSTKPDT